MRELGRYFPGPLVGIALLLGVLIVLTPFLSSGQPSAGTIFSQAVLYVDALPGNSTMHFYLHGLGTTARYDNLSIGLAYGFPWTGGWPSVGPAWGNWTNGTNVLAISTSTDRNPVAVNVSALYVANGQFAVYQGLFAFNVTGSSGSETLAVVSNTAGTGGFTTPVASLPVGLTLALVRTGSAP